MHLPPPPHTLTKQEPKMMFKEIQQNVIYAFKNIHPLNNGEFLKHSVVICYCFPCFPLYFLKGVIIYNALPIYMLTLFVLTKYCML